MPQMVKYVRRIEALELQRTLIDKYYGEQPGVDIEEARIYDDDGESDSESESGEDETDSDEEDEELVDSVEDADSEAATAGTYYPHPVRLLACRPTVPRVPGKVIISSYGATDFIRALWAFLSPITHQRDKHLVLLPSDRFDLWHKVVLNHPLLPFALSQPPHRDVIRVRPPEQDLAGRAKAAGGVFDTVLFAADRNAFGLECFRAGRVHAIFTLPPHLQHLHSGPLVYPDAFTPFMPDTTISHGMFSTTAACLETRYASIVLPLNCLTLACHLAPDFSDSTHAHSISITGAAAAPGQRFFFNTFYNYFVFLLMAYWRRSNPDLL
ncbi:hypothetical protein BDV93DRAFT_512336 [Ceratobasidium sp. AG-I]|nr:hypothetical protein BDV93DRAFT_512336 [Ceratobasidium sp. AG-I]